MHHQVQRFQCGGSLVCVFLFCDHGMCTNFGGSIWIRINSAFGFPFGSTLGSDWIELCRGLPVGFNAWRFGSDQVPKGLGSRGAARWSGPVRALFRPAWSRLNQPICLDFGVVLVRTVRVCVAVWLKLGCTSACIPGEQIFAGSKDCAQPNGHAKPRNLTCESPAGFSTIGHHAKLTGCHPLGPWSCR
jgi:hypothetical protein